METITFYSYKGGAGRSLALANAAVYLAKLGFRIVALDFDLEAPGLHYKFSRDENGLPLPVDRGVVDYVNGFLGKGEVAEPLSNFVIDVPIPGIDETLVRLMPAGRVPSSEYWRGLSQIDWHDLFYKKGAQGVQIFRELQARILDEFEPDFLLVDSRTGITEMGGVATTLLADKVLCLVLPTLENLEGARAVLQSLKRSKREATGGEVEIIVAVSRLPEQTSDDEREVTDHILSVINQDAPEVRDTLSIKNIFVLHSEAALQLQESLRIGGGTNPDDSILLRDYLRLFAPFVPRQSIEKKLRDLVENAWEKLRHDPDAAVKDMEEYAESFGHPEVTRELIRFYQVRNAPAASILRRAQRLWEITDESNDPYLWSVVNRYFEPTTPYQRSVSKEWKPNLDFVRSLWQGAGNREPKFGLKLAEAYNLEDKESAAADVLLDVIKTSGPLAAAVSRAIFMLDYAKRTDEAQDLVNHHKATLLDEAEFANAWARHALREKDKAGATELANLQVIAKLRPTVAALIYIFAGVPDKAASLVQPILSEISERQVSTRDLEELGVFFRDIGKWDEFESIIERNYPGEVVRGMRERLPRGRRR